MLLYVFFLLSPSIVLLGAWLITLFEVKLSH